jgi:hypothetical protein
MPDYSNGKIYKIYSNQHDKVYVGSTVSSLSKRFSQHKEKYKKYLSSNYHYITSFDLMKYDDVSIDLLCNYPCNSRLELEIKENEFIQSLNCVNKVSAGKCSKINIIEYRKSYYIENIEKIKNQVNEYRISNLEIIKDRKAKYYKDKGHQLRKEKDLEMGYVICDCGGKYKPSTKYSHINTLKHSNFISNTYI